MVHTNPGDPSSPLSNGLAEGADSPWGEDAEQRSTRVDAALHGGRLDKAVVSLAPEFSRAHLQSLIDKGHVRVDGRVVTLSAKRVQAGQ
ncbi:MAG: pseudouridine synthase, partial [Rhizobacter sp.]|nr:pseudouridine synthase [Rhizobacter sp.]